MHALEQSFSRPVYVLHFTYMEWYSTMITYLGQAPNYHEGMC